MGLVMAHRLSRGRRPWRGPRCRRKEGEARTRARESTLARLCVASGARVPAGAVKVERSSYRGRPSRPPHVPGAAASTPSGGARRPGGGVGTSGCSVATARAGTMTRGCTVTERGIGAETAPRSSGQGRGAAKLPPQGRACEGRFRRDERLQGATSPVARSRLPPERPARGGPGAGTVGRKLPARVRATEFLSPRQSGPGDVPLAMNESSSRRVASRVGSRRRVTVSMGPTSARPVDCAKRSVDIPATFQRRSRFFSTALRSPR
jgi:hypothetical protein